MQTPQQQNLFDEPAVRAARILIDGASDLVFDYAIPPGMDGILPGCRVEIPLRHHTATGTVLEITEPQDTWAGNLKPIRRLIAPEPRKAARAGGRGRRPGATARRVKYSVDEVKGARPAAAAAYSQVAAELGLCAGGEGRRFFMPDVHPFNGAFPAKGVGNGVEAVAYDSVDPLDARLFKDVDNLISN